MHDHGRPVIRSDADHTAQVRCSTESVAQRREATARARADQKFLVPVQTMAVLVTDIGLRPESRRPLRHASHADRCPVCHSAAYADSEDFSPDAASLANRRKVRMAAPSLRT